MRSLNAEYLRRDRSPRTLRRFGFRCALFILATALLIGLRHIAAAGVLAIAAIALLIAAEFHPRILLPLHRVAVFVALILAHVVPPVLLTLIFYLLVTPLGLLQRLLGQRQIDFRFRTKAASYWAPRQRCGVRTDYEKQF
jgi:cell division protein FtsW (lipid II flippase)